MTPTETMAKARWELWRAKQNAQYTQPSMQIEPWEDMEEDFRIAEIEQDRAALRALAECKPTEKMLFEHGKAMGEAVKGGAGLVSVASLFAGFKAAILAAAEEGEESET